MMMKSTRLVLALAAIALCTVWAVAQQAPPGPPPGAGRGPGGGSGRGGRGPRLKKVMLAWADTRNGVAQHDFTSHALAIIERLGYESNLSSEPRTTPLPRLRRQIRQGTVVDETQCFGGVGAIHLSGL